MASRILTARYGAIATVAALATQGYLSKRTIAHCEAPYNHVALSHPPASSNEPSRRQQQSQGHPSSPKRGDAGLLPETADDELDSYSPGFEDDDTSAWLQFSRSFNAARKSLNSVKWTAIGDKITDFIVPGWARQIPDLVGKLQSELSMAPGSLADEIWSEAGDTDINPEILWDAHVRIGTELSKEELTFRRRRKEHVAKALAKYLDLNEKDIASEDVPTIAMCGSGGGLRALVAGTSSYLSAQEAGLFDCVTYTAGVSGSCWLQALYFSSVGGQNHSKLISHLKNRIGVHIAFPPPALNAITTAPTNKFLLSGFVEKLKGDPGADFGLVDIYGLLLAARLLVPKGELGVCDSDLKVSNQRQFVDHGESPLPIYTAVRHEIPIHENDKKALEEGQAGADNIRAEARKEAWFQWFEITPYEFFCEEFSAGIPTWALGRPFKDGRNVILDTGLALPELRVPLMLGIWGSAFCATLSHYYKEVRPLMVGLAGFGGIDHLLEEKNQDLIEIHPIDPATVPNFVVGMKDRLPATCPDSVFESDHLKLMDAGMSNNIPIYPLLRPGRDVDVVIAFDASADIKRENWLSVVDGYARQRGIKGWPVGSGWPKASSKPDENAEILEEAEATSPQEAASKVAEAREDKRRNASHTQESVAKGSHIDPDSSDLGYCTVWVGTSEERTSEKEPPPSKRISPSREEDRFYLMEPNAGMAVVYFPFLPNPKVPGIDPDRSEFMSTWNFIYTPEQIDSVVDLARANFEEGQEQVKSTVRAVYERKKKLRQEREERWRIKRLKHQLREHGDHFA